MRLIKLLLLNAVLGMLLPSCTLFKNKAANVKPSTLGTDIVAVYPKKTLDSVNADITKAFKGLITANAITDTGFFNIHKVNDKYYLEIPDGLLDRDILLINRIIKGAADNRPLKGMSGYSGDQIGEKLIRFIKGPNDKLFVKAVSYKERSIDTSSNGMYRAVSNSNLLPIVATFPVKALKSGTPSCLIDITDFISSDQPLLAFDVAQKKNYGLGGLHKDKSYVIGMQAFATNLELQTVNTYTKGDEMVTYELNTSMVLLPAIPMKPRYADKRVGYFERGYLDFDEPQGVVSKNMITRWKLEPKNDDIERYEKGELVEPMKPIVYYIDPATPKKWVPYLIQGVNDWQKAFEKAGFKNAIYALEAPKDDKSFSLYDAQHNAIIYKPSVLPNASGPHVNDPRSGEILETHINWYHNVMSLIHDWYMVQAGPNDSGARQMVFDDELMGQLIRFVSSHEVGHTLGLTHNFGSSSKVPVDSLRSKGYLQKNGFCPSIMDYARFNYVAQPVDKIPRSLLLPRIGVYDEWAIEFGYRWQPEFGENLEESVYMHRWVSEKVKNKELWYSSQGLWGGLYDPRTQAEDLGDNAMKAGTYGIANLKRVMAGLTTWTETPLGDYSHLQRMNGQVVSQYQRYIDHVLQNLLLPTRTVKYESENGNVLGYVPKAKRIEAIKFLHKELFNTPNWLISKDIFSKIGGEGFALTLQLQEPVLDKLLTSRNAVMMQYFNDLAPKKDRYTFDDLLSELEFGIWKELYNEKSITVQRRMLQRIYAEKLIGLCEIQGITDKSLRLDAISVGLLHLRRLRSLVARAIPQAKDKETRLHLEELKGRFSRALNQSLYTKNLAPSATSSASAKFNDICCENLLNSVVGSGTRVTTCWFDSAFENWFEKYFEIAK